MDIFLHENVKNFMLIPNFTFLFFDDPKKSYVVKLCALQQNYDKWGGQYVKGIKMNVSKKKELQLMVWRAFLLLR